MQSLVVPMYAMVLLTMAVALRLMWVRVCAIRSGEVKLSYFRSLTATVPTEVMAIPARHFINLFEVPVLFYAACLVALILNAQSEFLLMCAWGFVAFRILQAMIHLTYNNVRHRMLAYMGGYLMVMIMWTHMVWLVLQ